MSEEEEDIYQIEGSGLTSSLLGQCGLGSANDGAVSTSRSDAVTCSPSFGNKKTWLKPVGYFSFWYENNYVLLSVSNRDEYGDLERFSQSNDQANEAFDPSPENFSEADKSADVNGIDTKVHISEKEKELEQSKPTKETQERTVWDNPIEFLMSCIATSVGLGNVWRFPFVAYNNGGGAFLIPYIIVLVVIGKPMYYLETVIGQFSSRNCVKVWSLSPAMKGTGYAQALGASYVLSYYVSIIALCLYYLVMSFFPELPWSVCQPEWDACVPSIDTGSPIANGSRSSAELYFVNVVLQRYDNIDNGIGAPLWDLTVALFVSWLIIFVIVVRGVKSSGKAAYFLAIFPYIVMIILLVRAVTLPGAGDGILFFLTPDWGSIIELRVWYAAVTQVFFSLSVCSGALIMFASYNTFNVNVYRDSMIVTTLDTFTSLISGITIFGILGNLAHQLNVDDITQVIGSGGTALAFISYPDAIAKMPVVPQLFAVLFFLMMAVLGVGSGVALLSTVNTVLMDAFPRVPVKYMSAISCTAGFLVGLVYVTPGGQFILELVDFYGGTFMRLFAAITETIGVFWIYGLENLCLDIEFMLGLKPSIYWRICWAIVTPVIMIAVFMYEIVTTDELTYGGVVYPDAAYIAGNIMQYTGVALVPLFILFGLWKFRTGAFVETVKRAFRAKPSYGPRILTVREEWRQFRRDKKESRKPQRTSWLKHVGLSLVGGYKRS
ncbi:Sodium-dependent nutrient amino acid transporter 1 [Eumeta japonica]|uniref:Transporter n=1 Tax=Eumeta variegata TaxID=151549 RepID=A0A4C1VTH3_EUMVA|nr:Sodium-dependent nutrient amino acid transporter 1 [Eumeta japonica]